MSRTQSRNRHVTEAARPRIGAAWAAQAPMADPWAQSCRDPTAHCHSVIDDPFSEEIEEKGLSLSIQVVERPPIKYEIEIKRFSFPCKFLLHRFRFQKEHPATAQDQIQAAAVSQGCDWCPNFNPDNWKQVGVRKIVKEYFL